MSRVFTVKPPTGKYFLKPPPSQVPLPKIILSSHAYITVDRSNVSYRHLRQLAGVHLVRRTVDFMDTGKTTETPFFTVVQVKSVSYLKTPLFFPYFTRLPLGEVEDRRRRANVTDITLQPHIELYDYQRVVMPKLVAQLYDPPFHGGILVAECGSGKTGLGCCTVAHYGCAPCVLVTTKHVMGQWAEEFQEWFGFDDVDDVAYIGGGRKAPVEGKKYKALICTMQSLSEGSKQEALYKKILPQFDMLISDECHHMAADTFFRTISHFNGRYRLALTATLERGDGMVSVIPYSFGPVICRVQEDLTKSTYERHLHTLSYNNPEHADVLKLRTRWRGRNANAKPKMNYAGMLSRVCNDKHRTTQIVLKMLEMFPDQRMMFLSYTRCQAEFVSRVVQRRLQHRRFGRFLVRTLGDAHQVPPRLLKRILSFSVVTLACDEELKQKKTTKRSTATKQRKRKLDSDSDLGSSSSSSSASAPSRKRTKLSKSSAVPTKKRKLPTRQDDDDVFLYMGGESQSQKKRKFRDGMLKRSRVLSCTSSIAGEAFNVRNVHVLGLLGPQKPNKDLQQQEGRTKRGRNMKRVDVVTVVDSSNPVFSRIARSQIRWFEGKRYTVHNAGTIGPSSSSSVEKNPKKQYTRAGLDTSP